MPWTMRSTRFSMFLPSTIQSEDPNVSNLDPFQLIKQEFEVKLQTLAAEFRGTLDEIHTALEGITKGSSMAFDVVRMELSDLTRKMEALEKIVNSPQVSPQNTDMVTVVREPLDGREL